MNRLERFVLSMIFALIVAGVTLVVVSAQTPEPVDPAAVSTAEPQAQQGPPRCPVVAIAIPIMKIPGSPGHMVTPARTRSLQKAKIPGQG